MDVFLASALDIRLIDCYNINLLYLAGNHSIKNGKIMDLYLAGENGKSKIMDLSPEFKLIQKIKSPLWYNIYILESFFYAKNNQYFQKLAKSGIFKKILLDSGAFTFLQNKKVSANWEKYIEDYASFINQYDIKLFFELDIDKIIGLDKVEFFRDRLEKLTGKKPIPVWHKNRGKDYFLDMCDKYPYVALGGIVIKEFKKEEYDTFTWFINEAHKRKTKIHGLGFTNIQSLKKYHFDSVDSTAWLYGVFQTDINARNEFLSFCK